MRPRAHGLPRLRGEDGAAAVEFALVLVPLILVIIGVVDFGRVLYTRNNMIEAADFGARVILLDNGAGEAAITDEIRDAFIAGPSDALAVQLGTASENGIQFRTISLAFDFDFVTPLLVTDRITMRHTRRVPLQ